MSKSWKLFFKSSEALIEYFLKGVGLWVLKMMAFGRYRDTYSYLHFLPGFVGFVSLLGLLFLVVLMVGAIRSV
ncbi:hypothetical protein BVH03_15465 [Pseudomonas sp. PA15(2017)]|nr:hypothetical protein BVH03_15465 [Pseudomonas sp. PA15(2017)]